MKVIYAGNIGAGQGLERIIPKLAKKTEDFLEFKIIGDGGNKELLIEVIQNHECKNVQVFNPVPRAELVSIYSEADILFLHLNNFPAFTKVIPSKIFEYAATNKPILAGVAGFTAEFVQSNIKNSEVFEPCNEVAAKSALDRLRFEITDRSHFTKKYNRTKIMHAMAKDFVSTVSNQLRS